MLAKLHTSAVVCKSASISPICIFINFTLGKVGRVIPSFTRETFLAECPPAWLSRPGIAKCSQEIGVIVHAPHPHRLGCGRSDVIFDNIYMSRAAAQANAAIQGCVALEDTPAKEVEWGVSKGGYLVTCENGVQMVALYFVICIRLVVS